MSALDIPPPAVSPASRPSSTSLGSSTSPEGERERRLAFADALAAMGRFTEAEAAYEALLAAAPDFAPAWTHLGSLHQRRGRADKAAWCHGQAVALAPDLAPAHTNLSVALTTLGRLAEAEAAARQALALRPDWPVAYCNLAVPLRLQGRFDEAAALCLAALRLDPRHTAAYVNLSASCLAVGQFEQALQACDIALHLSPHEPGTWRNRGVALGALGRLEEAEASLRAALVFAPDDPDTLFNLALVLLKKGAWKEGFELYEVRLSRPEHRAHAPPLPLWDGGEAHRKRLLVYAEQGLGDVIQFLRFVPWLAAQGAVVSLEVPRPLYRLVQNLDGVHEVIIAGEGERPAADAAVPLVSLARHARATPDSVGANVPYLFADPVLVAAAGERLGPRAGERWRGGLVWAGDARPHLPHYQALDRRRSMRLADFAPLASLSHIRWFSLQMGPPRAELAAPPPGLVLEDAMHGVSDFADTAAILAHLDFLVSVDTAPAHLAGALGKPVFLLSRFDGCWRWLNNQPQSPWYPTLRLYAQPTPGDWTTPLQQLCRDLEEIYS